MLCFCHTTARGLQGRRRRRPLLLTPPVTTRKARMRIEKLINCTGMPLLIPQGAGDDHEYVEYPAAQVPARVVTEEVTVAGLDVRIVRDLGVEGLPDPQEEIGRASCRERGQLTTG